MVDHNLMAGAPPLLDTVRLTARAASRRGPLAGLFGVLAVLGASALGCGEDATRLAPWQPVAASPRAALLSVGGTSERDVWLAGADDGAGPVVLRWDGSTWAREPAGVTGDLWWVHAAAPERVYFGGERGHVLVRTPSGFERLATPGLAKHVVFGVWAPAANDVYAVGSARGINGFIWHFDGGRWSELALPSALPRDERNDVPGFYKVWGNTASDVWVVGDRGVVLRGSAARGFELVQGAGDERLFTVHGAGDAVVMVGGSSNAAAFEARTAIGAQPLAGSETALVDVTPPGAGLLQGTWMGEDGELWSVGLGGATYHRASFEAAWEERVTDVPVQSLHAVWSAPDGSVWSVGGNVLTSALDRGVALRLGASTIAAIDMQEPAPASESCPSDAVDPAPQGSIGRRWVEQLLGAMRRDSPRVTVHARNAYHVAVALWDAWAAYDAAALGVVSAERLTAALPERARAEALSYAAYRVLRARYASAPGGATSLACFEAFMAKLGHDASDVHTDGDDPRALGNRVAAAVLARFADDGANEANDYADTSAFSSDSPRLLIDVPGAAVTDPLRWQPVGTDGSEPNAGAFTTPHWGAVLPFALEPSGEGAPYVDVPAPPATLDAAARDAALLEDVTELLARGAELDAGDGVRLEPSPQGVLRGDVARAAAELWSEAPGAASVPGVWLALASRLSDDAAFEPRVFGAGPRLTALDWDVHVYLALGGALHDAAIATWQHKRRFPTARPITLVRYLAGAPGGGAVTAQAAPSPSLPVVPGLIERITAESSLPGARHAALARYVGELAVRAYRGEPPYPDTDAAGVGWVRATEWLPYAARAFVTPPSPAHVSATSSFGAAAARVLAALTGSAVLRGAPSRLRVAPGALRVERGPREVLDLEWPTYAAALEQSERAQLWNGSQLPRDAALGRTLGDVVGARAVERAALFFAASAPP